MINMNIGGHITVENEMILFKEYDKNTFGRGKYCKSFSILVSNVKCVAVCPRLPLDDEWLYIVVVTKNNEIHKMPDYIIGEPGLKDFEMLFGLDTIIKTWELFTYEDHARRLNKIIYPKSMYWQELFLRSKFEYYILKLTQNYDTFKGRLAL